MPRPTSRPAAEVGPRLRGLIEQSGRSMRDVAREAGIDVANLSRICAGATAPTVPTAAKILGAISRRWADLD